MSARPFAPGATPARSARSPSAVSSGSVLNSPVLAVHCPVVTCARHHQDHPFDPAVTELELQPTLERLEVVEACLDVDPDARRPTEVHVPGPKIALRADQHLRTRDERLGHVASEATGDSQLSGVSDR
jgi:hypothetical protein